MAITKVDVTFNTGKFGVNFNSTPAGGATEIIKQKDDMSLQALFVEYVSLNCSSGANVSLIDGSAGGRVLGPVVCGSGSSAGQFWDFKDDPLVLLAPSTDTTESLCVSASAAGVYSGFVKGYWGSKPISNDP